MSEEEASAWVRRRVRQWREDARGVLAFVRKLGCLPLAVEQACAFAVTYSIETPAAYLAEQASPGPEPRPPRALVLLWTGSLQWCCSRHAPMCERAQPPGEGGGGGSERVLHSGEQAGWGVEQALWPYQQRGPHGLVRDVPLVRMVGHRAGRPRALRS